MGNYRDESQLERRNNRVMHNIIGVLKGGGKHLHTHFLENNSNTIIPIALQYVTQ